MQIKYDLVKRRFYVVEKFGNKEWIATETGFVEFNGEFPDYTIFYTSERKAQLDLKRLRKLME